MWFNSVCLLIICSGLPSARMLQENSTECGENNHTTPGFCPEVFDDILCWPETPSGTTANQSCPGGMGSGVRRYAYKECWDNGTWFLHPESLRIWTNYTTCVDHEDLQFRTHINHLFVIGYSISLVPLIISLIIFFMFRTLKCTRIRIHIQLFVSFALNNFMWILWYKLVVPDPLLAINNEVWCQALYLLIHYFMVSNYMWMFCEGLHLHLALVVVFVREEVTLKIFFAIGWVVPAVMIVIYGFARVYWLQDTFQCWMNESYSGSWILTGPVCISLLASLIFLGNVLRVILTIMHPNSNNPAPLGIRRAVRAALILIPLFGLQHILIPFRPEPNEPYEHFYQYVTVFITTLQGLCVSCLFCFANQDVHQAIRGFMHRKIYRTTRWSNYHYTGAANSAGVYVVNGSSQCNNVGLLSLKRKSTTITTLKL